VAAPAIAAGTASGVFIAAGAGAAAAAGAAAGAAASAAAGAATRAAAGAAARAAEGAAAGSAADRGAPACPVARRAFGGAGFDELCLKPGAGGSVAAAQRPLDEFRPLGARSRGGRRWDKQSSTDTRAGASRSSSDAGASAGGRADTELLASAGRSAGSLAHLGAGGDVDVVGSDLIGGSLVARVDIVGAAGSACADSGVCASSRLVRLGPPLGAVASCGSGSGLRAGSSGSFVARVGVGAGGSAGCGGCLHAGSAVARVGLGPARRAGFGGLCAF